MHAHSTTEPQVASLCNVALPFATRVTPSMLLSAFACAAITHTSSVVVVALELDEPEVVVRCCCMVLRMGRVSSGSKGSWPTCSSRPCTSPAPVSPQWQRTSRLRPPPRTCRGVLCMVKYVSRPWLLPSSKARVRSCLIQFELSPSHLEGAVGSILPDGAPVASAHQLIVRGEGHREEHVRKVPQLAGSLGHTTCHR